MLVLLWIANRWVTALRPNPTYGYSMKLSRKEGGLHPSSLRRTWCTPHFYSLGDRIEFCPRLTLGVARLASGAFCLAIGPEDFLRDHLKTHIPQSGRIATLIGFLPSTTDSLGVKVVFGRVWNATAVPPFRGDFLFLAEPLRVPPYGMRVLYQHYPSVRRSG
jgi:hypothetical protein